MSSPSLPVAHGQSQGGQLLYMSSAILAVPEGVAVIVEPRSPIVLAGVVAVGALG